MADTEAVTLRLPRELLEGIDQARREMAELATRPEAVRRALADWLKDRGHLGSP